MRINPAVLICVSKSGGVNTVCSWHLDSILHFTPQEKIFLICLCAVIFVGSAIHFFYKIRPDFGKMIELTDSRAFIRRINVNKVSANELAHVPYIGEKTAQKIIEYRRQHGPFRRLNDLYAVPEISLNFINKIIPYLKVH